MKMKILSCIVSLFFFIYTIGPQFILAKDDPARDSGHNTTDVGGKTNCTSPSEKCRDNQEQSPVHIVYGN